jgi:major membrane immunogen (membrane-anchored lipoprotein)
MADCELLENCGFFRKYQGSNEFACKAFIEQYCKGSKMNQCKRKEYRNQHGEPPSDDMLPTGGMMKTKNPAKV